MNKTQDASIIPNIWILVFSYSRFSLLLCQLTRGQRQKADKPHHTDHLRPSCENAALQVFTQTLLNAFRLKLSDSNPSNQHLDITKCGWQGRVGEIQ